MKNKLPSRLVFPYAKSVVDSLSPHCARIEILGSLRRGKKYVGDVELLAIPKGIKQKSLFDDTYSPIEISNELIDATRKYRVYSGGLESGGKMVQFYGPKRIAYDLFIASYENYGYQKVIRTGPLEHNVGYIIPLLKSKGFDLRDAHIWKGGVLIPVNEEADLYGMIGLDIIPPNERQFFKKIKL
jgi:DNA polymerase/3'-5' exonuclease PolX